MARVALVTGGTRGIGGAIAKALRKAGYNVAVNYAGNDVAAKAFKKDTKNPDPALRSRSLRRTRPRPRRKRAGSRTRLRR